VAVCEGIKRSGGRCTVSVESGQTFCHHHDPSRSEERKRAASRAGKSRPSRELLSIKRQLQGLTDSVLAGEVERADAAVCGQLLNVLLRAHEQERKAKELEELEERLSALEASSTLEVRCG
jgi:glutathione S-transferase